jgi:hypothetical protein
MHNQQLRIAKSIDTINDSKIRSLVLKTNNQCVNINAKTNVSTIKPIQPAVYQDNLIKEKKERQLQATSL